ncbi:MAG: hypothetical protein ISR62_08750 [Desulfobacteraceae bacterium]|nr:hypothetical protein [Desulfobacteraceae bacterium]
MPNLNVLFEFGYFNGHHGKSKVAILKYGDFLPPFRPWGPHLHLWQQQIQARQSPESTG